MQLKSMKSFLIGLQISSYLLYIVVSSIVQSSILHTLTVFNSTCFPTSQERDKDRDRQRQRIYWYISKINIWENKFDICLSEVCIKL